MAGYDGYYNPQMQNDWNARYNQLMSQYQQNGYNNMNQMQPYQQQMNQQMQYQQQPQQVQQPMQNQQQMPQNSQQMSGQNVQQSAQQIGTIKGAIVTSADEARAVFAPADGSMILFPTTSRKYIYCKEMDTLGNAPLLTYILDETPPPPPEKPKEFVEKSEISTLYDRIDYLQKEIKNLKDELGSGSDSATTSNSKQNTKPKSNDKLNSTE